MSDASTAAAPALGVSFQLALDEKRQLVFQTHMDALAPPAELNKMLDKVVGIGERQYAKYQIIQLKRDIWLRNEEIGKIKNAMIVNRTNWEAAFSEQQKRRQRGGEFTLSEAQTREEGSAKQNIKILEGLIKRLEEELAEAEAQVAAGE